MNYLCKPCSFNPGMNLMDIPCLAGRQAYDHYNQTINT